MQADFQLNKPPLIFKHQGMLFSQWKVFRYKYTFLKVKATTEMHMFPNYKSVKYLPLNGQFLRDLQNIFSMYRNCMEFEIKKTAQVFKNSRRYCRNQMSILKLICIFFYCYKMQATKSFNEKTVVVDDFLLQGGIVLNTDKKIN